VSVRTYLTQEEKARLLDFLKHNAPRGAYLFACLAFEYGMRPREALLAVKFSDVMITKRVLKQKKGSLSVRKVVRHPDLLGRLREIEVGDFVVPREGYTERTCLDYYTRYVKEALDALGINVNYFSIFRHTYINHLAKRVHNKHLLAEAVDMKNPQHIDYYLEVDKQEIMRR